MNKIEFYRASGEYGFLSNLYKCSIAFEGEWFDSSEGAYQYGKPKDFKVKEWLRSAPSPRLCALAAHTLLIYDIVEGWSISKLERMKRVLWAKFTQNPELMRRLIMTGEAELIEASKTDQTWGIGKSGKGKNLLGKYLMETREILKGIDFTKPFFKISGNKVKVFYGESNELPHDTITAICFREWIPKMYIWSEIEKLEERPTLYFPYEDNLKKVNERFPWALGQLGIIRPELIKWI